MFIYGKIDSSLYNRFVSDKRVLSAHQNLCKLIVDNGKKNYNYTGS